MRWMINKKGSDLEISNSPVTISRQEVGGESGHETYILTDENNRKFFFKLNKNNQAVFSIIETMVTVLWNFGLPQYTPKVELVFDSTGKISGVVSHGISGSPPGYTFSSLKREHTFTPETDYFSVAGGYVNAFVHQEDDGHLENKIVMVDEKNQIKKMHHIDFDMSYLGIQRDLGGNVRAGTDRNLENLEIVEAVDMTHLPMLKKAVPHFSPGVSRPLVKENGDKKSTILNKIVNAIFAFVPTLGFSVKLPASWNKKVSMMWNTLLVSLRLKQSSKGFGESFFSDDNLTRQFTQLTGKPKFVKEKWYHFARYLLIPEKNIEDELNKIVESARENPEDFEKAKDVKAALLAKYRERREKIRKEVLKIPQFVEALQNHQEDFLIKMVQDDDELVKKGYGQSFLTRDLAGEMEKGYLKLLKEGLAKHPRIANPAKPAKTPPRDRAESIHISHHLRRLSLIVQKQGCDFDEDEVPELKMREAGSKTCDPEPVEMHTPALKMG